MSAGRLGDVKRFSGECIQLSECLGHEICK